MRRLLHASTFVVVAWLLADAVLAGSFALAQHQARTDHRKTQQAEPYGGCDEAYRYPNTKGYRWCARNGYLD